MGTNFSSEAILGKLIATGANESLFLDDPEAIFLVEEGFLDIFCVETEYSMICGRRNFIARLQQGSMAFCGPGEKTAEGVGSFQLIAVPSRNAVITRGERAALSAADDLMLDATIWIDDWVAHLSEFLARSLGQPPLDVQLLEAEPCISYPADAKVSAQHLDVVWVSTDRPVRLGGWDEVVIPSGGPPLPLTERTWLGLDGETEFSAAYTPGVFVTGQIWPALDTFNALVQQVAIAELSAQQQGLEVRHRRVVETRRLVASRMFHRIGEVLGRFRDLDLADATGQTPLQAATKLVADAVGGQLAIPRRAEGQAAPLEEAVKLARRSRIFTRRIALAPGWWQRDGPPFVAMAANDDERPLALLPKVGGGYRAVDPTANTTAMVDEQVASTIAPYGLTLYPPLPDQIVSGVPAMLHALRGFGREFAMILAMAVLAGLVALVTPVLTGKLLAEVIPRVDVPMWVAFLGAIFLAAFGSATFEVVRAFAVLRVENRVDERLQAAVWGRLLSLPARFFRDFSVGDLADRANGISRIRQLVTGVATSAIISGVFSIFSLALLFYYNATLALSAGGLVLVLIGATWVFARGQMSHFRAAFDIQGALDGLVFQLISGLPKLRIANAENHALAQWAERFAEQKRETLAARRWLAGQMVFNGMFTPLSMIAIFAIILFVLFEGDDPTSFDLADFLSFNSAFGQFAGAMTGLASAWTTVVAAIPLFERVQPILAAQPETVVGGADPGDLVGDIEFTNVSFRYAPEVPNAVDEVSFRIRAGEYVAFVGASGSGKSTLYRLLLGFEQPDSGSVFIDGQDLATLDQSAVRSRMGVVLQNGRLQAASILKNIVGSSALTVDDAWQAAHDAGLADDIRAMPMGMHTVLPEGGGGLSGGQKQRLLIARALIRNPRVLLLDEATSALDNRTQEIVQKSLKSVNATRVVIAHRLSTVHDTDRIYVMQAGRIAETGHYKALIERDGIFAALARRQLI